MESEEALKYYINEVKDSHNEIEAAEEHILNEAEQATEFLQKAGLGDLTDVFQQGKEITENLVIDSVRNRHLTEKQAQTIRSRVKTLNKTLRNRQNRRKHRQDIRDVTWNIENIGGNTRSRSATPDSLDSVGVSNEELTSDEDHQLVSLPPYVLDENSTGNKTKIKWTSSEPLQNKKFNRERGDIAHLGSANVILKGYQPLTENGTPKRERSGSDPTTDIHLDPLKDHNPEAIKRTPSKLSNQLSRSHNSLNIPSNNCTKVYISNSAENESVSFEGLMKQNESEGNWNLQNSDGTNIDELSDSEYQYLKPLLYVELVAIFDQYKISCLKRKASNKNKGGNVFGVNLSTLIMRDMPVGNSMVPDIFKLIIDQLNSRCICEDGILRIAGQKQKLELLCHEIETKFYNNHKEAENLLKQATVHDLTGVLKKLLRDLPDPIFTMELFDMFYKTSIIPNGDDKIRALNLLVLMLPVEHRNTFRLLLQLLLNIIKNEKFNRMNLHNVAMISAPSFFPPRLLLPKENTSKINVKQLTKEELARQINGAAVCCSIMETLLKAGENLWNVPGYLVKQARWHQKRAQERKDTNKDKRTRYKTKLVRSSTQYEAGVKTTPKIKEIFLYE